MKRRTRYFFIGLGFLVFGIISPLIVFYVSGFSYDWKNDELTSTGLLSIKTEPSKANIFLDGEDQGTSPASLRFLKPKEYQVSIRKEGYFDWNKKLEIKAGKVTWASDRLPELHLIARDPAPIIVSDGVKDFFPGNDFVIYIKDKELVRTDLAESPTKNSVKLSQVCGRITVSPTQNIFMLQCEDGLKLYDQTSLKQIPVNLASDAAYEFGPDDNLYSVENGNLYKTSSETGQKQEVASRVAGFGFQGNSLYLVTQLDEQNTQSLVSSPLYNPLQTKILVPNLGQFANAKLYIARSKEIFLYTNNSLYRINEQLEQLVSGVSEIGFDADAPALTYTTGHELMTYDFSRGSGRLIVRHTAALQNIQGKSDIGYILYIHDNKIQAAETDTRDSVNNYVIADGQNIKKFQTDPTNTWVYYLDSEMLKFFRLR